MLGNPHGVMIQTTLQFGWSISEAKYKSLIHDLGFADLPQESWRAIAPGFAKLARAKRASHIDPPASSYAIMRRAYPYRGENPEPGKDVPWRA
jgi:hypothetical protein